MNLVEHYNNLYNDSIQKIEADLYTVDKLIDASNDNRRGISLLIRPEEFVKNEIQLFLEKLKLIEPTQYYYRYSDIHITVMSIISCYSSFNLKQINIDDYIDVIRRSIENLNSFEIEFRGITASPSCVMIQGFLSDNTLNSIRDNLRCNFDKTSLEQSLDKRYSIHTAHSTIVRLRNRLANKSEFIKTLNDYRNYYFGTFTVSSLELVFNDWYQRIENVKTLYQFNLECNEYKNK